MLLSRNKPLDFQLCHTGTCAGRYYQSIKAFFGLSVTSKKWLQFQTDMHLILSRMFILYYYEVLFFNGIVTNEDLPSYLFL